MACAATEGKEVAIWVERQVPYARHDAASHHGQHAAHDVGRRPLTADAGLGRGRGRGRGRP